MTNIQKVLAVLLASLFVTLVAWRYYRADNTADGRYCTLRDGTNQRGWQYELSPNTYTVCVPITQSSN